MYKTSLPEFPNFVALELDHRTIIEDITHRFPAYSDFNFISLFSWDTEAGINLSVLNNNLVVRFNDYETNEIFLSFIGTHKLAETIPTLLDYCHKHHLPVELRLIPQSTVNELPNEILKNYTVTESRNNHDYILSVKKICELGSDYHRKRKVINSFIKNHDNAIEHGVLDLELASTIADIKQVMEDWKTHRKASHQDAQKEFTAINRTLSHAKSLNIKAYGLHIDGRLVAFTLFEIAPENVAIFHFTKANIQFKGVFEYIKYVLCKYLETLDVQYINIEQDLGIEGLRQAKESYKPVKFLKKYTVSPK